MASPYVTKADIEKYLELEEERKALQRRARDLEKQASVIEDKLTQFVQANGGKARSLIRSGYRLAITLAKGSVAWKTEFVRVAGAEAAEALVAAAPPRESLAVEPA